MNTDIKVNTSPAMTFAKLNMNGGTLTIDPSGISEENARVRMVSGELKETDIRAEEYFCDGIGVVLGSEAQSFELKSDAVINIDYQGSGIIHRVIRVAAGVKASIVEVTRGRAAGTAVNNTSYLIEEGAGLKLIRVQLLDKDTVYADDLRAVLEKDATFEVNRIDLGGALSYLDSHVRLLGKGADYRASGDYLLNGEQRLDINMVSEHIAPDTQSDMRSDGALLDRASKIFRGTLDFKSGCKGAKGSENEDVIMLSPGCGNQSLPIILCGEEDVEGNHGASVGKISDEILFYLAARGFDEKAATALIVRSRISSSASVIPDEGLRSEVERIVDEVLS